MNDLTNLLPQDGQVYYLPEFLSADVVDRYLHSLLELPQWRSDVVKMFGKEIVTARKVVWFGDPECGYTYSGKRKEPEAWNSDVIDLKAMVERFSEVSYNSCLANLYHHGGEGMGWHADNEKELGLEPNIAVISLGAERKFKLKHRETKEVVDVMLGHGSLLMMSGETQKHWLHTLPVSKRVKEPRVSLTFRQIMQ